MDKLEITFHIAFTHYNRSRDRRVSGSDLASALGLCDEIHKKVDFTMKF